MSEKKDQHRFRRKIRIRARVKGKAARPRLSVYRSLHHLHCQIIDDDQGRTLVSVSTIGAKAKGNVQGAKEVGKILAKKAKESGVASVVFDRGGRKYHGKVKAIAEAAREGGLQF